MRDKSRKDKLEYLHKLIKQYGEDKLIIFKADLIKHASFDKVFKGCNYVIHAASPVSVTSKNPEKEIIKPAIDGATNVLNSILRNKSTIKKIVYLSSMEAVVDPRLPITKTFNENDWNNESSRHSPYAYSKAISEKMFINFHIENFEKLGIKLIRVCPGWVIGPILRNNVNLSVSVIRDLVTGKYKLIPKIYQPIVDVRDVSKITIDAIVKENMNGRYLAFNRTISFPEVCNIMRELYSELNIPSKQMANWMFYIAPMFDRRITLRWVRQNAGKERKISNKKSTNLGFKYTDVKVTLNDTIKSLDDFGLI